MRSYRRIARIRDGNSGKNEEPKTGTDTGEKEQLEFESESKGTATAPKKGRRSAAFVAIRWSNTTVGRITADLGAELIREDARRGKGCVTSLI
jgi:hypothetical protein